MKINLMRVKRSYLYLQKRLDKQGIKHVYYESPVTGHEWLT
jgi:hypothetical protein